MLSLLIGFMFRFFFSAGAEIGEKIQKERKPRRDEDIPHRRKGDGKHAQRDRDGDDEARYNDIPHRLFEFYKHLHARAQDEEDDAHPDAVKGIGDVFQGEEGVEKERDEKDDRKRGERGGDGRRKRAPEPR